MKTLTLYLATLCLCFTACKKIISIDTDNAAAQMVIEANITDQLADQQIKITKSVGYSDQSVYPKVSGASVTVTDSKGVSYLFTEKSPGLYVNRMKGVPGLTYNLQVNAENKNYTATAVMPKTVKLDSVGVVSNTFFGKELKTAAAYLADPSSEANYYHFYLYVNGLLSKRIYVNDDRLTNGNKLRLQLYYEENDDDDEGLKTGDKVSVEMECIDANVFKYWYALSQQSGRGPNQGTTPSNPTSNISNNALGYFSAHTYQQISITAP
ncbi:DUF4249 domain-containing protein [Pedobacter punctiformis]|uniref:DUF4249 domain-containing protein n=1 Tax=Pedobacter punctiformis TaxID=3004097 RepID=A0ABT4LBL5_9SPHI|nr:DUF4249 domain-containing protein [Pedobacter sp. HCMS5-2]MCZ4245316.1 DUF4249 domain-containing protein [Pedobacter sp. HCMS5-2]